MRRLGGWCWLLLVGFIRRNEIRVAARLRSQVGKRLGRGAHAVPLVLVVVLVAILVVIAVQQQRRFRSAAMVAVLTTRVA